MKTRKLDLSHVLSSKPKGGIIHFLGQRTVLIDARAFGFLRKELINNLGLSVARNILTRLGYAHGWLTADNLDSEYPELLKDPACGPALHMLQGMVNVREFKYLPLTDPVHKMTCIWEDCVEAEQHIIHQGVGAEPVCWTMTGYVSGYISRALGWEHYCMEHKCQGRGDALCHIEARSKEDWGDLIDDHIPFFKEETIDGVLKEMTTRLRRSERRLSRFKRLFHSNIHPSGIITNSEAMRQVLDLARRAAKADSSVIITGESGVGKELIARFIHDESSRAGRPFVAVNCGAVAETLLESEFFGHAKGSFTGAERDRIGLFEAANGGTILLDEIGEMPPGMQMKLLRVLQEKAVRRVGENRSRSVDAKVIAATNRDLEVEVEAGRFRRDLYYRLCVIELTVPPLRDRLEDILPLAHFFLEASAARMGRSVESFSPSASEHLLLYSWPGNVRELQNLVERAVALCSRDVIHVEDLPSALRKGTAKSKEHDDILPLAQVERNYILTALEMVNGNKRRAAEKLQIGLASLYRKLKEYRLQ
ncbi:MAG: sigma-54-dependent Fis family transcriptional regulator [Thermodesulfobacteriota bacterium]